MPTLVGGNKWASYVLLMSLWNTKLFTNETALVRMVMWSANWTYLNNLLLNFLHELLLTHQGELERMSILYVKFGPVPHNNHIEMSMNIL